MLGVEKRPGGLPSTRAMACVCGLVVLPVVVACGGATAGPAHGPTSSGSSTSEPAAFESDEAAKTPWEACYSTFTPSGDAKGDLARIVRDCGPTGGMKAVTAVRTGTQSEEDPVDRYSFEVPSAGKCYRVYSASAASVGDLDLLLRGPSGDAAVADLTHDSWPVLPPREPICFTTPGLYMLEVSVYRGSGQYALQVWGR